MIESPTIRSEAILHIPTGQWFAPKVASLGQLITLAQSRYMRRDGAILESKGQFLFRWQIEETMTAAIDTINWSELTPVQRDQLVTAFVMREKVSLPYTQDMSAAWRVVNSYTDAIVNTTHIPGTYCHCRIKPFTHERAHHGFSLDPAQAICKAALRRAGFTITNDEEDIINLHRDLAVD